MDWTIVIDGLKAFGAMLLPAIGSNLVLWVNKAAADGKFERWELKEGLKTVTQVFIVTLAAFLGLEGAGVDVAPLSVALIVGGTAVVSRVTPKMFDGKKRKQK